jgi:TM2 domain-containing membrane protein YozV
MGVPLSGQDTLSTEVTESELPIVVIMDFIPKGIYPNEITIFEAQILTNEFAAQVVRTGKVTLYDQVGMREVMDQTGFVSSECTDPKCVSELGQLLKVAFVINGNVEKVGDMFSVNAFMVDVAADSIKRKKNVVHVGEVDEFITEIEILAWEIMGADIPRALLKKRNGEYSVNEDATMLGSVLRSAIVPGLGQIYTGQDLIGYIWMGSGLTIGLLAYNSYDQYKKAYDDVDHYYNNYLNAKDPQSVREFRNLSIQAESDEEIAAQEAQFMINLGIGVYAANLIHAFLTAPKSKSVSASNQKPLFDLVYNQKLKQPQLRFSIALD